MTVHYLQTAKPGISSHPDADAVRMMILNHAESDFEDAPQTRAFGNAKIIVSARFPNRQVLTMGKTTWQM
ncbi:MAG: hypothetical protein AB3N11_01685 [Arenibacterium sp.]